MFVKMILYKMTHTLRIRMFVKIILFIMTHTFQIKNQNKKLNTLAFFVIYDAILSLTLKGRSLKPNIRQGLYMKSYLSLYQAVSAFGLNKSFDIAKEDYDGKKSMCGYDLTADQDSEEGQLHPIKTGSL